MHADLDAGACFFRLTVGSWRRTKACDNMFAALNRTFVQIVTNSHYAVNAIASTSANVRLTFRNARKMLNFRRGCCKAAPPFCRRGSVSSHNSKMDPTAPFEERSLAWNSPVNTMKTDFLTF